MSETIESIACPHGCGTFFFDLWNWDWVGSHEEIITMCTGCDKPVTLYRSVSYRANADTFEEDNDV